MQHVVEEWVFAMSEQVSGQGAGRVDQTLDSGLRGPGKGSGSIPCESWIWRKADSESNYVRQKRKKGNSDFLNSGYDKSDRRNYEHVTLATV